VELFLFFFFVDPSPLGHHFESVHIILHKEKEKRLVNDATAFAVWTAPIMVSKAMVGAILEVLFQ